MRLAVCAVVFCIASAIHAQSAADLQTLADLKTASKQMRLESEGVSPFRLQLLVETTGASGEPTGTSHIVEEFAGGSVLRRTFAEEGAPAGAGPIAASASTGSRMTYTLGFVIDAALHPGPSDHDLETSRISYRPEKAGTVTLRCVVLGPKEDAGGNNPPVESRAYCLAPGAPVIRLAQLRYGTVVTYNGFTRFGGRLYARDVAVSRFGQNRARLHIAEIVAAPELAKANAPVGSTSNGADATAVYMEPGEVDAYVISKAYPDYPPGAKLLHISGSVFLGIVIDKEGRIDSTELISAPATDLAAAAVEAVRKWRYKPYLVNGTPAVVITTAEVRFKIGR